MEQMSKLRLSVAMGNYDRTRPLVDGDVQMDGTDPIYMLLSPEEMFFRAFRDVAFDISELSLSSFTVKRPPAPILTWACRCFRRGRFATRPSISAPTGASPARPI